MNDQGSRPSAKSPFSGARLLIVDDEKALRRSLAGLFKRMDYQVSTAASGEEALELIASQPFDLVILDLRMPDMNGAEVLEAASPVAEETIFIILTAYGTLDSAISGIRHGAFDYLLKPSPIQEIVQAVEAGLAARQRRLERKDPVVLLEQALQALKNPPEEEHLAPTTPPRRFLQASGLTIDTARQLVVVDGKPTDLTPTEYSLITYMMKHCNRVISCSELVLHARGYELDERDARVFLRSHIHRLRQKIERDPSAPSLIQTVRGRGYLLKKS